MADEEPGAGLGFEKGITLEKVMTQQGFGYVPVLVEKSIEFLSKYLNDPLFSEEGSQEEVRRILKHYSEGRLKSLDKYTNNPNTICDLLISFFSSLADPIIQPFNVFISLAKGKSECTRVEVAAMRKFCDNLPENSYNILDSLINFLNEGLEKGATIEDLSKIGPSLCQATEESDTQVAAEAVQYLITHAKRLFGIRNLDKLSDLYEDQGDLGMGTYAVVKKIKHIETGTCYAAKIIQKQHLSEKELGRLAMETNILKRIRHPNVIALKAICETENELFLIMELAHGGSLIDHVKKNAGSYSEDTVINITRQILDTLVFLHDLHIVHRDIKPENILLRRKGTLELKMADFGLSKMFDATIKMATMCGSPAYVAPEVLTGELYGKEVDMWSVGVLVYLLLFGRTPFTGSSISELFKSIVKGQYEFPENSSVSGEAKDFIRKLLILTPASRMSARLALDHRWLVQTTNSASSDVLLEFQKSIESTLQNEELIKSNVREEVLKGPEGKKKREVTGIEHCFKLHKFFKPVWCDSCEKGVW
eukprot:CAMPEP_0201492258 /NCGR_PEP_ID=MMETSP0151_2-20130828/32406_1 /ASSEMBLY_ACC=CAM_ASM_000257 /TAXON_ID=200890 /ORGANISM="Paramoeba atlantica, Strain 621/1 / CCAP 1560/9" /LENGTH=535 /DNA_ID=CAMNT_0047878973 /DNA_START=117 /DNA_END=1721 /DNA_ORIENTATION=-